MYEKTINNMMNPIKITTQTETTVKIGDVPLYDVLKAACELAHYVLEELSIYRQENNLNHDFGCEGDACAFLDMIGD